MRPRHEHASKPASCTQPCDHTLTNKVTMVCMRAVRTPWKVGGRDFAPWCPHFPPPPPDPPYKNCFFSLSFEDFSPSTQLCSLILLPPLKTHMDSVHTRTCPSAPLSQSCNPGSLLFPSPPLHKHSQAHIHAHICTRAHAPDCEPLSEESCPISISTHLGSRYTRARRRTSFSVCLLPLS